MASTMDDELRVLAREMRAVAAMEKQAEEERGEVPAWFPALLRAVRESTPKLLTSQTVPEPLYKFSRGRKRPRLRRRSDYPAMTQEQAALEARRLGLPVDASWWSKVERGLITVEPDTLRLMVKALRADDLNEALLFDALGYNCGSPKLLVQRLGYEVVALACFDRPFTGTRQELRQALLEALEQARDLLQAQIDTALAEQARRHETPDS